MWLTEHETDHLRVQCRVIRTLHREQSKYQDIAVVESREYGRMLVLDGVTQTTLRDEYVYHEMIAHVPLFAHEGPERVLVIGGGDGGTVREVLKHKEVKRVELVEIDERVVEVSRMYLPELSTSLDDPRVTVRIADGIEYIRGCRSEYDVVLIDSSDPMGPAEGLFTSKFYGDVARALRRGGMMVTQSGAPFFMPGLVRETYEAIAERFRSAHLYLANVPSYSVGPFSFVFAAKDHVECEPVRRARSRFKTRYYSSEVHRAAFALPVHIKDLVEGEPGESGASIA